MSSYPRNRNSECKDLHLYKKDCTNPTYNCEQKCGMPGLDATIESDGTFERPGCELNEKGRAMQVAYHEVVYPVHTYEALNSAGKPILNSAGKPVERDLLLEIAKLPQDFIFFSGPRSRGGNGKPLLEKDYLKLREWRAALAKEIFLRNEFEEKCIWKRDDKQPYTATGWQYWGSGTNPKVPDQEIDLTARNHQGWRRRLADKIHEIDEYIKPARKVVLDDTAKVVKNLAKEPKLASLNLKKTSNEPLSDAVKVLAADAAAAEAPAIAEELTTNHDTWVTNLRKQLMDLKKEAAEKEAKEAANTRTRVEEAVKWVRKSTLDDVFEIDRADKSIKLKKEVDRNEIIMLLCALTLLTHSLGPIEPPPQNAPKKGARNQKKPATRGPLADKFERSLDIEPHPPNRHQPVYHTLSKWQEPPMHGFHNLTSPFDKYISTNRVTDPLVIVVRYQKNSALKEVLKTVILTLLIRLCIAAMRATRVGYTRREEILEEPKNNFALWEEEILDEMKRLHDEGILIKDPIGELGSALNVNPEQLFRYALSDRSLYCLYQMGRAKIPKSIFPTAGGKRITNIEFNTSNNSSQRIIDQLYNLFDNQLPNLTAGKNGLTFEKANKIRKTMAENNVANARDALIELDVATDAQEELRNQLFNLAACSLAAAQESWLNIIYDEHFIEQLTNLETFAKSSPQKTETIVKFIEQAREKAEAAAAAAAAIMEGETAATLEQAEEQAAEEDAAAAVAQAEQEEQERTPSTPTKVGTSATGIDIFAIPGTGGGNSSNSSYGPGAARGRSPTRTPNRSNSYGLGASRSPSPTRTPNSSNLSSAAQLRRSTSDDKRLAAAKKASEEDF